MNAARCEGRDLTTTGRKLSDALRAQLHAERDRADRYERKWLRTRAEFQDFKRRTEERHREEAFRAGIALVREILPVQDELARLLDAPIEAEAGEQWLEGLRLIHRKLRRALQASGVQEIPAEGEAFDPRRHEAAGGQASAADRVVRVLEKGYRMDGHIVRRAKVLIGADGRGPAAAPDAGDRGHQRSVA
jgi:molecular chaperone GrpE